MPYRLDKLPQVSLRDRVVTAIRNAIIQGKFKSGEKIPEHELARDLGVSRTPIREAIRILEQQRLVETRPKTGTYVAVIDWAEVQDSLYVRMELEEFAMREALERLSAQEWEALCDSLQILYHAMQAAIDRSDPILATELDVEWHTSLIDAAQNRYLSHIWRSTGLPFLVWSPERELYPFTPEKWNITQQRHQELLTALRSRDSIKCTTAVRQHILNKLSDMQSWLAADQSSRNSQ